MPEPPGLIRVRGWLDRHRWTCAIVAVTLLAGGLRLHALGRVPSNPFYDAAVRSMLHSWHNFFFGAFEPSGRVSIDKPPIDLWAQVISVKLFGFTSVALKLPQAIAGTLTVPLLYDLARRAFGRYAGLTSAIAYAVLPLAVVTARSDTMDSLMAAIVVLAAWLIVIAAQHERPRLLFLAAAVMGVAFNVKLFEALVALPAIVVLYYLATRAAIPHRARRLAIAAAIFVVTALSWVTLASLGPSNSAPFPIGSTDGTVFNVVFVYDGIDRLKGKPQPLKANRRRARGRRGNSVSRRLEVDHPGLTRLFVNSGAGYGRPLGSELLPALLFGGVAVILAIIETLRWHVRRYRLSSAAAIAIAVWLLTGFVLFSSSGALHARYLEAFTPAIALALGAGVASLALRAARRTAPLLGLLAMLAVSTLYEYDLTSNTPHV
ncbi:MAG TPA: glycosyltransferase family 39 protein, partial [Solirubrobacteraceae bacterium]|nr:glycosyltransferase family 39 protein [Solirubrobacteraceae bacterium]